VFLQQNNHFKKSIMDINDFIKNFADQFDETPLEQFSSSTNFRDIDEWDSLTSLSIIAMVDEEYGVKLTGEDFRNSNTIEDIFNLVSSRV